VSGFHFNQVRSAARRSFKKRRPAGVSRRQKHRRLQFEPLEDRHLLSANPVAPGVDEVAAQIRDQLLDTAVLNSFARVSDLSQYSQEELAATTQWVVLAELGSNLEQLGLDAGFNVESETGVLPGSYTIDTDNVDSDALIAALSESEIVDYFYPLVPSEFNTLSLPDDPYLKNQWNLINFGQQVGSPDFQFIRGKVDEDINIEGAWDSVTGNGVQIGIVDTSIQQDHPDLVDNIRSDLAVNIAGGSLGTGADAAHGTAVAGIAAGVGNNGIGIAGVAYNADIVPIQLIGNGTLTDLQISQALLQDFQTIDVYNNSWGLVPLTPRTIVDFGPLSLTALRNSVFFGRGGLGSIHVWASGNDASASTSSQYDGFVNSRYTIGVTAVDHDGVAGNVDGTTTAYAEGGANVLVAAPSGSVALGIIRDTNLGSGIWTTDLVGEEGANTGPDENGLETDNDFFPDLDFTSRFSGTSAAAPVVSGVIALMLEANPTLTYRDVQNILVRAARQAQPGSARRFQLDYQSSRIPTRPTAANSRSQFDMAIRFHLYRRSASSAIHQRCGIHREPKRRLLYRWGHRTRRC